MSTPTSLKPSCFLFLIRPELVQTLWMTLQSLWFHMCYQPCCVRWSHTCGLKHTFANTQILLLCFLLLYLIVEWVGYLASSPFIVSLLSKAFDLVFADCQILIEWDKVAQTSLLCTHTASSCQCRAPVGFWGQWEEQLSPGSLLEATSLTLVGREAGEAECQTGQ